MDGDEQKLVERVAERIYLGRLAASVGKRWGNLKPTAQREYRKDARAAIKATLEEMRRFFHVQSWTVEDVELFAQDHGISLEPESDGGQQDD